MTNNGYSDAWGVGVRVGYMGQFTEQFAVGAAYATKISMGDFDSYKGLFARGRRLRPAVELHRRRRVPADQAVADRVDFERIFYDDSASVSNPSTWIGYCPPPPMGGGQRDYCLGGSNGAGFGWQNIDVWKIGVQYEMDEQWTFRGGYNHRDNPIQSAGRDVQHPGAGRGQGPVVGSARRTGSTRSPRSPARSCTRRTIR